MPKPYLATPEQLKLARAIIRDEQRPALHKKAALLRIKGLPIRHIALKLGKARTTIKYWLEPSFRGYMLNYSAKQRAKLFTATGRPTRSIRGAEDAAKALELRRLGLTIAEIAKRNKWGYRKALRLVNPITRERDNERARVASARKRIDPTKRADEREKIRKRGYALRREAGVPTKQEVRALYEKSIPSRIRDTHDGRIKLIGTMKQTPRGREGVFRCCLCKTTSTTPILLTSILAGNGILCSCEKKGYDKFGNIFDDSQLNLRDPCQVYVYQTVVDGYIKPGISVDHRARARLDSALYKRYICHWDFTQRYQAIILEHAILRSLRKRLECPPILHGAAGYTEIVRMNEARFINLVAPLAESLSNSANWADWALENMPRLTPEERDGFQTCSNRLSY